MDINGRMKVKTLKSQFKDEFGLTLRVYDGRSFAGDDATLASIRKGDSKGGEFTPRKNTKVGNLEDKIQEMFGIKTQIAGSDDSYLCDNDMTLQAALEEDGKKLQRKQRKADRQSENVIENNQERNEAESFNFTDLNTVEEVLETFVAIEDKICERGFLVTLTEDLEAEISIRCEVLENDEDKEPVLAIRIESEECNEIDSEGAESLADFIGEKVHDCFEDWPEDIVEEYLEMMCGYAVLINGNRAY